MSIFFSNNRIRRAGIDIITSYFLLDFGFLGGIILLGYFYPITIFLLFLCSIICFNKIRSNKIISHFLNPYLGNVGYQWRKEIYLPFGQKRIQLKNKYTNITHIPCIIHIKRQINHINVYSSFPYQNFTIPLTRTPVNYKVEFVDSTGNCKLLPYELYTPCTILPTQGCLKLMKRKKKGSFFCWKIVKIGQSWPELLNEPDVKSSSSESLDSSESLNSESDNSESSNSNSENFEILDLEVNNKSDQNNLSYLD